MRVENILDMLERLECMLKQLDKLLHRALNLAEDIRESFEEMTEYAETIYGVTPDEFGDFYDYEFEHGDYLDQGEWE